MSHIYDAMRKAELAYATFATKGAVVPLLATVPADKAEQTEIADHGSDFSAVIGPMDVSSRHVLRIEDILARCTRPQWLSSLPVHSRQPLKGSSDALARPDTREQFDTLGTRLRQLANERPLKTLLITSSIPAEGKTFLIGNLARTIVRQVDRSVLIVDANLRCGAMHDFLGAPAYPGLTEYLAGAVDEMAVMQHGHDRLFLIPSGEAVKNPVELLSNGRLKILLDRVATAFDWIFLDCPACLPFADASVMAAFCDAVLLVVKVGPDALPSSSLIQKACQELKSANLIGQVLNVPAPLDRASMTAGFGT